MNKLALILLLCVPAFAQDKALLRISQSYLAAGIATDIYMSQNQPEANPFYMRSDGMFNTQKGIGVGIGTVSAIVVTQHFLTRCRGWKGWCGISKVAAIGANVAVGTVRLRAGLEH